MSTDGAADLYHSALEVRPRPRSTGSSRWRRSGARRSLEQGVVAHSPVGPQVARPVAAGSRYEVGAGVGGSMPDVAEAVDSPRGCATRPRARASGSSSVARALPHRHLGAGRQRTGDMGTRTRSRRGLVRSGTTVPGQPPAGGPAPGGDPAWWPGHDGDPWQEASSARATSVAARRRRRHHRGCLPRAPGPRVHRAGPRATGSRPVGRLRRARGVLPARVVTSALRGSRVDDGPDDRRPPWRRSRCPASRPRTPRRCWRSRSVPCA